MKKFILLLATGLMASVMAFSQEAYDYNVYVSANGDSLLYRSLKPAEMKAGKKYPLVLVLHDAGKKGNDNEKQLLTGAKMFLNPINREKHPAFVVIPQCPAGQWWTYNRVPKDFNRLPYNKNMNLSLTLVKEVLDQYLEMPEVDKSRIYVMGASMGGCGTYDIVAHYPEIFAAAIPICGAIAPGHLGKAKDVAFRIFHGDDDATVPVECSRRAYKELRKVGAKVEYFEIPSGKHGINFHVYNQPDFMDWMFRQKKQNRQKGPTAGNSAYNREVFVSQAGDSLLYRYLEPEVKAKNKKYPLVIFLHGAGERGNDNEKQLMHGSQMFLNPVNRINHPAYVLFPQCPSDGYWAYSKRPDSFKDMKAETEMPPIFKSLKELIDSYLALPDVDKKRVYIIGLSMGAMGTYDLVARFPEIFAAAVPICGTVNPERLSDIKDVNFRIFHGDADPVVPVDGSRNAYRALIKAGVKAELHEFPGCGHNSWNPAFNMPDFMDWLFSQKKHR